jgi:hypothetical protein
VKISVRKLTKHEQLLFHLHDLLLHTVVVSRSQHLRRASATHTTARRRLPQNKTKTTERARTHLQIVNQLPEAIVLVMHGHFIMIKMHGYFIMIKMHGYFIMIKMHGHLIMIKMHGHLIMIKMHGHFIMIKMHGHFIMIKMHGHFRAGRSCAL